MHYASWTSLTDKQLALRDVGEVNLAAAFGLPKAGELNIPALREQLDRMAGLVVDCDDTLVPEVFTFAAGIW